MGGKSPPQQTQTNQVQLSPEQQKLFQLALPHAEAYAGSPLTSYNGQTIANFMPNEVAAQNQYVSAAAPTATDLATRAAASQTMMLDPAQLDPNSNPYISAVADQITGKVTDRLTQQILPNVRGTGTEAGGMYAGGSTRQQMAERLASSDAVGEMGNALERLYMDSYNAGLGNISRAIAANPSVQAQQLFGADVLASVGGQQRAMEQAQLDEALKKWTIEQQLPYMRASEIMGLVGGMPGATGVTTMTGAAPRSNPILGGAGGALSGAAAGTMIMPGVGTALGALIGGASGYFGSR